MEVDATVSSLSPFDGGRSFGFHRGLASNSLGAFRGWSVLLGDKTLGDGFEGATAEGVSVCGMTTRARDSSWILVAARSNSDTGTRLSGKVDAELPSEGWRVASGSAPLVGGMIGLMSPALGRMGLATFGALDMTAEPLFDGVIRVGGPMGTTDVAPGIEGTLPGAHTPLGHGFIVLAGTSEVVGAVAGTV